MSLLVAGLFLVGVAALVAELFLPTFGIVGVIGAGSLVASVVVAFRLGGAAGPVTLLAALVVTPTIILLFFKFFPRTYFGKRLILSSREDAREGFTAHAESLYAGLPGRAGLSVTAMRPSGTVEIDGVRHDATTSGEFIEAGTAVRVALVEGNRIVVNAEPGTTPAAQRRER